ncbi:vWA domain-containing protein [Actinophytocola sp.]|uniref:vWA domain-containing protein n=1 Tax=Actinophytocola sp. TaxID=1872138 RepID=UPI003D6A8E10
MTDHLEELNTGLREFRGAVHADASVAARVRCRVIGFAETPMAPQPLESFTSLPKLEPCAGTNFGPAFTFVHDTIDRDVRGLKEKRLRVHRPIVFFLSDGQPTDPVTWPAAFAALAERAWAARPNVIAFGIGEADRDTLCRIGTFRTFLGRDGVRMSTALIASVISVSPLLDRI